MSLKTSINLRLQTLLQSSIDLSTPEDRMDFNLIEQMLTGTGDQQADQIYHDRRTLTGGATDLLDMTDLVDPLGQAISFAFVKLILIRLRSSVPTHYVEVGAAPFPFYTMFDDSSNKLLVQAGGIVFLTAPYDGFTVDPGQPDLRIYNPNVASIEYDIILVGTST